MPIIAIPKVGAMKQAGAIKTLLALSKMRLYKAVMNPTPNTTIEELEANEADYDGYAEATLTAWNAPYLDPSGGATIASPYEQFEYGPAAVPPVGNFINGFWVEDAAGVVALIVEFDGPVSMNAIGDALPAQALLNLGRTA